MTTEAIPPAPYGLAIVVVVGQGDNAPCRFDAELEISIVGGRGERVDVRGPTTATVGGRFPLSHTRRDFRAAWRLGRWCPPLSTGPYSIRLEVDGAETSTTTYPFLSRHCAQSGAEWVNGVERRPPEGRWTPVLARLPT